MNILCIEDNDDIQTLMRIVLRSAGYDMAAADSAEAGFAWLDANPLPDAVLLDVQMPKVDGWEVLRTLRARPDTAEVPVIMCTVKSRPVDQAHGWELGCDAYVQKPFDIETIIHTLRMVLARTPEERVRARAEALRAIEAMR